MLDVAWGAQQHELVAVRGQLESAAEQGAGLQGDLDKS